MHLPIFLAIVAQSLSVGVSVSPRVETTTFHFDNPSSFASATPVPHFFEQRYESSPRWLSVFANYEANGLISRTRFSVSPNATRRASDIDTFFETNGDVITSGTDGSARLRGVEVREELLGVLAHDWRVGIDLSWRRDTADFLPADIVVTHTTPGSTTRTYTTDQEFTTANAILMGLRAERAVLIDRDWHLTVGASVRPLVFTQLIVQLPQKYPGQDLSFSAYGFGSSAGVTLSHQRGPWHTAASIEATRTWSYRSTSAYTLSGVVASIAIRR